MTVLTITGPDYKVKQIQKELAVRAKKGGLQMKLTTKKKTGPKPKADK